MREKVLYCIWGSMYILCTSLSFVSDPPTASKIALAVIAVLFFVPGAMILYDGIAAGSRKSVLRIRIISSISLGLTVIMLTVTFLCIRASQEVGNVLYELLILVSSPMVCGQYWIISLFLWSCLLWGSFVFMPKNRKK